MVRLRVERASLNRLIFSAKSNGSQLGLDRKRRLICKRNLFDFVNNFNHIGFAELKDDTWLSKGRSVA
jgi:hypothetical protein